MGAFFPQASRSFDMSLSPASVEELMVPGTEKTIVYSLSNHSNVANLRMQIYVQDAQFDTRGNMLTPKAGTYEFSAADWVEVSPTEFVVKPRQTQLVRATIKVPSGTKPGDYTASLLFSQRVVVPPVKERSTGQLVPSGVMGAVMVFSVPPVERKVSLENMRFVPAQGQKPAAIEIVLKNAGNSRARPKGNMVVKDSEGKTVYVRDLTRLNVVSRDSIGVRELALDTKLEPGSYEAVININPDPELTKQLVGSVNFQVKSGSSVQPADKGAAPQAEAQKTPGVQGQGKAAGPESGDKRPAAAAGSR